MKIKKSFKGNSEGLEAVALLKLLYKNEHKKYKKINTTLYLNKEAQVKDIALLIVATEVIKWVALNNNYEYKNLPQCYWDKHISLLINDCNSHRLLKTSQQTIKKCRAKVTKNLFKSLSKTPESKEKKKTQYSNNYIKEYYSIKGQNFPKKKNASKQKIHCQNGKVRKVIEFVSKEEITVAKRHFFNIYSILRRSFRLSFKTCGNEILKYFASKGYDVENIKKGDSFSGIHESSFHEFVDKMCRNIKELKAQGRPTEEHIGDPSDPQLYYSNEDCKRFCKENGITYLEVYKSDIMHEYRNYRRNQGKVRRKDMWFVLLKIYLKLRRLQSYLYKVYDFERKWYYKARELEWENKFSYAA